jgi:NADPH-dependent curcumin reductase CurA
MEAFGAIVEWLQTGKLQYHVDVVDGLKHAPRALERLFDGSNTGKLLVRVSEEPSPLIAPKIPSSFLN